MKKKILALGACAFALALGLVACDDSTSANGSSGDENPVEVSSSSILTTSSPTEDPGSSSSNVIASEAKQSSSSVIVSSSSAPTEDPSDSKLAWQYLNPSIDYGTMTDTRDGQVYKTVSIGTQTWMAENLNYNPGNVSSMGSYAWSGCYNNKADSCTKYGRLYTWEVAMDNADCAYDKKCNASLKPATPVRGVCPSGWHLPSHYEFEQLINFIDPDFGYSHTDDASSSKAGLYLKSQSGWNSSGNGSDTYGFSALPGGKRNDDGNFNFAGDDADFWSSGEYNSDYAFDLYLGYLRDYVYLNWYNKYYARSVRCLKDSN